MHAITVWQEPKELRQATREVAAAMLACGIDPKKHIVFNQSAVAGHAQLAWVFNCIARLGWLNRMTQFKDKSGNQPENINAGLFTYPILQAADILLYQAAIVPVGDDQSQHLELTRDIAQRFNSLYGETFVVPGTSLPVVGARIMGLDDPTVKMSKSETGAHHAVGLLDPPDKIRKTIMRATTDSSPAVDFDNLGEGVRNLLTIYQAFTEWDDARLREHFTGMRYGELKKQVAAVVVEHLEHFQQRYREITADPGYVEGVLREGAARVEPLADETVREVKRRMGLYC